MCIYPVAVFFRLSQFYGGASGASGRAGSETRDFAGCGFVHRMARELPILLLIGQGSVADNLDVRLRVA